jgi:hypothetical protein
VIVGIQDQAQDLYDDVPAFWRQMGEALAHGQSHMDSRLDGMNGRLDRMEGDISDLKTGQAETNQRLDGIDGRLDGIDGRLNGMDGRLDRMERANERFSNRVDAQFERLITWIQRSEIKGS